VPSRIHAFLPPLSVCCGVRVPRGALNPNIQSVPVSAIGLGFLGGVLQRARSIHLFNGGRTVENTLVPVTGEVSSGKENVVSLPL
jgi:hypothetical protein